MKTFREAARSYLDHGGEAKYIQPIIEHFGDRDIGSIYPFDVRNMAETLYPTQGNATKNRQALTPARAVLMHGYDRGWCQLIRIRRFREEKPKVRMPATAVWLHVFCRECDRSSLHHLAACVLFMAHTGARISEAVALEWKDVDLAARTAVLVKTKTSTNSVRHMTDDLCARVRSLQCDGDRSRVFRYTNRHSVNERIKAVCERAGIEYKSPHTCGRKTFATTAIELGMDVRATMLAGDWKSSSIFLETYVIPRGQPGRAVSQ